MALGKLPPRPSKPNYVNPQTHAPGVQITNIILIIVTVAILGLRLFTRIRIMGNFGLDDLLIVSATVRSFIQLYPKHILIIICLDISGGIIHPCHHRGRILCLQPSHMGHSTRPVCQGSKSDVCLRDCLLAHGESGQALAALVLSTVGRQDVQGVVSRPLCHPGRLDGDCGLE